MTKLLLSFFMAALLSVCNLSIAQSYEYKDGYIFEQKYVKRIPEEQAEKLISSPGLFSSLMASDWRHEHIPDSKVRRLNDYLIFEFTGKPPLSLRNFSLEPTAKAEGEFQIFTYLKSVAAYHIIGVSYMHDQPQFLLISKTGSALYFVNTN